MQNTKIHCMGRKRHFFIVKPGGKGEKGKVIPLQARCGPQGG
jgi:hypothetical protein